MDQHRHLQRLHVCLALCLAAAGAVDAAQAAPKKAKAVLRTQPAPVELTGARCVPTRGDLIHFSDVIANKADKGLKEILDYGVDVVAWGKQLGADPDAITARRRLIAVARQAGVRLHAVDCALVQEGGKCVVAGADRSAPNDSLYYRLRKNNAQALEELGRLVDLKQYTVLDVNGDWVPVPWLARRWRIPMASMYAPKVRQWYLEQMDVLAAADPSALHFDEPGLGTYALHMGQPGDFSEPAMAAFREWLINRGPEVCKEAGIETLEGFDYRRFVLAHGGDPSKAPLWRQFTQFQLATTRDFITTLRDRVRAKVGRPIPLSMNANPASWIKLPLLGVQDFMTTEIVHEARGRRVPVTPFLTYKLADGFAQPVAATAHGGEWYEMKTEPNPVLVCTWLALSYASGHHFMMPYWAWVMDPVKGSDSYQATTEHYLCFARFIKQVAPLLDDHEPVSAVVVVVPAEVIQKDLGLLRMLAGELADRQIPFCMTIEGNDLLDRQVSAGDLRGCSAVVLALPQYLDAGAKERIQRLAEGRPVLVYQRREVPAGLPRPIRVEGAEGVWVLPRAVPDDPAAPVVLHVLNRDYDAKQKDMKAKGPFTISVDTKLLWNRPFRRATWHEPLLEAKLPPDGCVKVSMPATIAQTADVLRVTVPRLRVWGLVELSP